MRDCTEKVRRVKHTSTDPTFFSAFEAFFEPLLPYLLLVRRGYSRLVAEGSYASSLSESEIKAKSYTLRTSFSVRHVLKFRPRQGRPPPARTGAVSSSAPAYATAAVELSILTSFVVDNELIVIPRWYVKKGGPLCNKTVSDVMVDYGFGVPERRAVGVKPKLFPPPDTRLLEGDGVLVQGPLKELQSLKRRALSVR